jgi:transposase
MRMKYTLSMIDGYVVSQFERLQSGYEDMADYVAAINIAARAAVKQPIVVDLRLTSKSRIN